MTVNGVGRRALLVSGGPLWGEFRVLPSPACTNRRLSMTGRSYYSPSLRISSIF